MSESQLDRFAARVELAFDSVVELYAEPNKPLRDDRELDQCFVSALLAGIPVAGVVAAALLETEIVTVWGDSVTVAERVALDRIAAVTGPQPMAVWRARLAA